MEDPSTFTAPWTGELPFTRIDEEIYEYACHEGNYALANILSGERAREREEAVQKKPQPRQEGRRAGQRMATCAGGAASPYLDAGAIPQSCCPADPIETSARPDRIMNQKRNTPGHAIRVVSR